MTRAIWDEARRAFRMTFIEGMAALRLGERRHAGWWADPYLRKGYLLAIPIFIAGALIAFGDFFRTKTLAAFFYVMIPAAILSNLVWFAVAARLRAKE